MIPALPSLEFLLDCKSPRETLGKIELACLDEEAKHAKRAKAEAEEARKYAKKAEAARWLIENLPGMVDTVKRMIDLQAVIPFPERKEEVEAANWRPRYAGAPSTAQKR